MKLRPVLTDPPSKPQPVRLTRLSTGCTFECCRYVYGSHHGGQWYKWPTLQPVKLDRPEDIVWSYDRPKQFDLDEYKKAIACKDKHKPVFTIEDLYGHPTLSPFPWVSTPDYKRRQAYVESIELMGHKFQPRICPTCGIIFCLCHLNRKEPVNPKTVINPVPAGVSLEELGFGRPFIFAADFTNDSTRYRCGVFVSKNSTLTNPSTIDCVKLFDCFQTCGFDKTARVIPVTIDAIHVTPKV